MEFLHERQRFLADVNPGFSNIAEFEQTRAKPIAPSLDFIDDAIMR